MPKLTKNNCYGRTDGPTLIIKRLAFKNILKTVNYFIFNNRIAKVENKNLLINLCHW